ncbi:hypothetical protein Goarm_005368 [Gossypium armourianum]|uniref:Uncharacterized protein n=1 Tax=Gossypium armourianum TaxID=34283 RepID=A0A7J9JZT0_9ROSI|nr:hypothetical protein [Gossypium armourianum]
MAKQFGDFIGSFVEYDTKKSFGLGRKVMRIRVQIDIRHGDNFYSVRLNNGREEMLVGWDVSPDAANESVGG